MRGVTVHLNSLTNINTQFPKLGFLCLQLAPTHELNIVASSHPTTVLSLSFSSVTFFRACSPFRVPKHAEFQAGLSMLAPMHLALASSHPKVLMSLSCP